MARVGRGTMGSGARAGGRERVGVGEGEGKER